MKKIMILIILLLSLSVFAGCYKTPESHSKFEKYYYMCTSRQAYSTAYAAFLADANLNYSQSYVTITADSDAFITNYRFFDINGFWIIKGKYGLLIEPITLFFQKKLSFDLNAYSFMNPESPDYNLIKTNNKLKNYFYAEFQRKKNVIDMHYLINKAFNGKGVGIDDTFTATYGGQ